MSAKPTFRAAGMRTAIQVVAGVDSGVGSRGSSHKPESNSKYWLRGQHVLRPAGKEYWTAATGLGVVHVRKIAGEWVANIGDVVLAQCETFAAVREALPKAYRKLVEGDSE